MDEYKKEIPPIEQVFENVCYEKQTSCEIFNCVDHEKGPNIYSNDIVNSSCIYPNEEFDKKTGDLICPLQDDSKNQNPLSYKYELFAKTQSERGSKDKILFRPQRISDSLNTEFYVDDT